MIKLPRVREFAGKSPVMTFGFPHCSRSRVVTWTTVAPCVCIGLLLNCVACSTSGGLPKQLLLRVQNAAPDSGIATPLALDGPFRRPVKKISSVNGHLALLIPDSPTLGMFGFFAPDNNGVWLFRDSTTELPTMLSSAFGEYWIQNNRAFVAFNPNSGTFTPSPAPGEGPLREVIGLDDRLVGVVGNNLVLAVKRGATSWTTLATLSTGETMISVARTAAKICALSSSSRAVWTSDMQGVNWTQTSTLPVAYGDPVQMIAEGDRSYVLTTDSLLAGDANCGNWTAIDTSELTGPLNSITVASTALFLASDDGLFSFDKGHWKRLEIDPTRSVVRALRLFNDRLYACHDSGIDESVDFGDHWQPSAPPLDHRVAVLDILDTPRGQYAAARIGLFHRKSKTDNWASIALPTDHAGAITALAAAPDGTVWIALTSADATQPATILRTATNGTTVENVTANLSVQKIPRLVWTEFGLFAGADNGVYVLSSSENTWRMDRAGMGDNSIIALSRYGAHGLIAASDSTLWRRSDARHLNPWQKLNPQPYFAISDVWSDPSYPDVLYAATANTLMFTTSPHDLFQAFAFRPERHPVPASLRLSSFLDPNGKSMLFLGTNFGGYFVYDDLRRHGWIGRTVSLLEQYQHDYSDRLWFWPVTVIGGFLSAYAIGISCLLLLLAVEVPRLLGRSWLLTLIAKPLTISPALGRWALFLGYERRLRKMPAFAAVKTNYFGLSANLPDGEQTAPDSSGQVLHAHILKQLSVRNCLFVLGRPGTGKTSVLSKLASLAGEKSSLSPLNQLIPVFVPAEFYKGDFAQAASRVLSERHGLPLDSGEMLKGQIEYGKMLFLFDGLSEVSTDRKDAANDMVRTANLSGFSKSLFVISSRFFDGLPPVPSIELLPLTQAAIKDVYLPSYQLAAAKEQAVLEQVAQFGENTPIDALLFAMVLSAAQSQTTSMTRSQLYQKYFRQVLNVESQEKDSEWAGWKFLIEHIADWFCLNTGRRAQGLSHFELMDLLLGKVPAQDAKDPMAERLRQYYGIKATDAIELLQRLASAGILTRGNRWRFSHDSFEEYFCAQRLISVIEQTHRVPDLRSWYGQPDDFLDIVRYFMESASDDVRQQFLSHKGLPKSSL